MATKYKLEHWTCERAASEWGCDKETLSAALKRAGIEPAFKDGTFSTRQVDSAINGDLEAERTRKTAREADLVEITLAEKRRELVSASEFLELTQRGLQAMTATVMGLTDLQIEHREKIIEQIRECGKSVVESVGGSDTAAEIHSQPVE